MALIVISVDRYRLPDCKDEEFKEWLAFELGESMQMSLDNPLVDIDIEAEIREISY